MVSILIDKNGNPRYFYTGVLYLYNKEIFMEKTLIDTQGHTITLVYESETDTVKVKNDGVDTDFREIIRSQSQKPDVVIELESETGENDGWIAYSDDATLAKIREFWELNKVYKD